MKKHLLMALCSAAVVCGLAGCGTAARQADPGYEAAISHVDLGGEFLFYQNLAAPMNMCNNTLANLGKIAGQDDPDVKVLVDIITRLLDLKSFKAQAASSVKVGPRLYVCKQFVLTAPESKSILSGKAFPNSWLENKIRSLPADTRIALCANVNTAYIWARINEEIAATGNQKLIGDFNELKNQAKAKGVDIDALAASACGPMMLVVSGKTPMAAKIAIAIADRDGVLSANLRKSFPPKAGESAYPIKGLAFFPKAQLVYAEGCLLLVSDPKILERPAKMLGDVPRYAKYLSRLPKEGNGFMIVDIPKKFANIINISVPEEYKMFQIKPFTIVSVSAECENGMSGVTVSSFSVPMAFSSVVNAMMTNSAQSINRKAAPPAAPAPAAPSAPAAPAPATPAPATPAPAPATPAPAAAK